MELSAIQQEILLVTGTRFLSRQHFEDKRKNNLTEIQQLEEACWNGALKDMLPELIDQPYADRLFLWHIKEATSFIGISLCEYPDDKDNELSIDPYYFLPGCLLS